MLVVVAVVVDDAFENLVEGGFDFDDLVLLFVVFTCVFELQKESKFPIVVADGASVYGERQERNDGGERV